MTEQIDRNYIYKYNTSDNSHNSVENITFSSYEEFKNRYASSSSANTIPYVSLVQNNNGESYVDYDKFNIVADFISLDTHDINKPVSVAINAPKIIKANNVNSITVNYLFITTSGDIL